MTDIFISYSSKDREWVAAFAGLLAAQGYEVWWDTSLLAGHDFQRMIPAKLDEAKCVIVVWTENSVESVWVRAEASRALIRNVLVPLQLRDAELPMPFGMFHTESFREWSGKPEDSEFQRLLRAVGQYVVLKPSRPAMGDVGGTTKKQATASNRQAKRDPHTGRFLESRQPVQSLAIKKKAKPERRFQHFGSKIWAVMSVVLLFGLVYALSNSGAVWNWLQKPAVPAVAKPESMETAGKVIELAHGMTLVKIPQGRFQMGSERGRVNEQPVHMVNIAYDFWMSQTEITFAQYDAYSDATNTDKPADNHWGRDQRPVINVSWDDAQGYAQWLSKNNEELRCRLPSESEWEYAARAGTKTHYFWGDDIGENRANCNGCGSQWDGRKTAPVASFTANKFELYDMHGNVREWVQDIMHLNYKGAPLDGSARETKGNASRIVRGGSGDLSPANLRAAARSYAMPNYRYFNLGFRVACVAR